MVHRSNSAQHLETNDDDDTPLYYSNQKALSTTDLSVTASSDTSQQILKKITRNSERLSLGERGDAVGEKLRLRKEVDGKAASVAVAAAAAVKRSNSTTSGRSDIRDECILNEKETKDESANTTNRENGESFDCVQKFSDKLVVPCPSNESESGNSKCSPPNIVCKDLQVNECEELNFVVENKSIVTGIICSLPLDRLTGIIESIASGQTRNDTNDKPNSVAAPIIGGTVNRTLCLYCDRSFSSHNLYVKHAERIHYAAEGRRLSTRNLNVSALLYPGCSHCNSGKITSLLPDELPALFEHLVDIHFDKYFACKLCTIRFSSKDILQAHLDEVHQDLQSAEKSPPKTVAYDKRKKKSLKSLTQSKDDPVVDSDLSHTLSARVVLEPVTDTLPPTITIAANTSTNSFHSEEKPHIDEPYLRSSRRQQAKFNAAKMSNTRRKQILPNDDPILSRLGLVQSRSPRTRRNQKNQRISPAESIRSETPSIRPTRSKNSRLSNTTTSVNVVMDTLDISPILTRATGSNKAEVLSGTFDEDFYENVNHNVRLNLLCHIDGKLESGPTSPSPVSIPNAVPAVRSTLVKSPLVTDSEIHEATTLATITAFPTLLTAQQYGAEPMPMGKIKKPITKNSWKWKWDCVKKYKYVNEGGKVVKKVKQPVAGLRDLSKLDMWTQLTMRTKHEERQRYEIEISGQEQNLSVGEAAREEKRKLIEQLNSILDRRILPQINLEQNDQRVIKLEYLEEEQSAELVTNLTSSSTLPVPDDLLNLLCLSRTDQMTTKKPLNLILSGEWARPRCYICFGCGGKFETIKSLDDHQIQRHPYVYSTHYEIVGKELIEGNLFRHFYIPSAALQRHNQHIKNTIMQSERKDNILTEDSMDSIASYSISLSKSDSFDTDSNSRISKVSVSSSFTTNNFGGGTDDNNMLAINKKSCTKCKRDCNGLIDLYRHMLDCSGDYAWLLAKKRHTIKYRYYGSRKRRVNRSQLAHRRPMVRPKKEGGEPSPRIKEPQAPRPRPSDAESIERMLANLPAKRAARQLFPNLLQKRVRKYATGSAVIRGGHKPIMLKSNVKNLRTLKYLNPSTLSKPVAKAITVRKSTIIKPLTSPTSSGISRKTRSSIQEELTTKKQTDQSNSHKLKDDFIKTIKCKTRHVVSKITSSFRRPVHRRILRSVSANKGETDAKEQKFIGKKTTKSSEQTKISEKNKEVLQKNGETEKSTEGNSNAQKEPTKINNRRTSIGRALSFRKSRRKKTETDDPKKPIESSVVEEKADKEIQGNPDSQPNTTKKKRSKTLKNFFKDIKTNCRQGTTTPTKTDDMEVVDEPNEIPDSSAVSSTNEAIVDNAIVLNAGAETAEDIDDSTRRTTRLSKRTSKDQEKEVKQTDEVKTDEILSEEPIDLVKANDEIATATATNVIVNTLEPVSIIIPPQPAICTTSSEPVKSPPFARKRTRKLNDCIAMLTGKLQEKLGVPFLESDCNILLKTASKPIETNDEVTVNSSTIPSSEENKEVREKIENLNTKLDTVVGEIIENKVPIETPIKSNDCEGNSRKKRVRDPKKILVANRMDVEIKENEDLNQSGADEKTTPVLLTEENSVRDSNESTNEAELLKNNDKKADPKNTVITEIVAENVSTLPKRCDQQEEKDILEEKPIADSENLKTLKTDEKSKPIKNESKKVNLKVTSVKKTPSVTKSTKQTRKVKDTFEQKIFDSSDEELLPWDPEIGFCKKPDDTNTISHQSFEPKSQEETIPKDGEKVEECLKEKIAIESSIDSNEKVQQKLEKVSLPVQKEEPRKRAIKNRRQTICIENPTVKSLKNCPKIDKPSTPTPIKSSTPIITTTKPTTKQRKKRKNELAQIIADQLLESFKEVDQSRIEELKLIHDLSIESNADELLLKTNMSNTPPPKRKTVANITSDAMVDLDTSFEDADNEIINILSKEKVKSKGSKDGAEENIGGRLSKPIKTKVNNNRTTPQLKMATTKNETPVSIDSDGSKTLPLNRKRNVKTGPQSKEVCIDADNQAKGVIKKSNEIDSEEHRSDLNKKEEKNPSATELNCTDENKGSIDVTQQMTAKNDLTDKTKVTPRKKVLLKRKGSLKSNNSPIKVNGDKAQLPKNNKVKSSKLNGCKGHSKRRKENLKLIEKNADETPKSNDWKKSGTKKSENQLELCDTSAVSLENDTTKVAINFEENDDLKNLSKSKEENAVDSQIGPEVSEIEPKLSIAENSPKLLKTDEPRRRRFKEQTLTRNTSDNLLETESDNDVIKSKEQKSISTVECDSEIIPIAKRLSRTPAKASEKIIQLSPSVVKSPAKIRNRRKTIFTDKVEPAKSADTRLSSMDDLRVNVLPLEKSVLLADWNKSSQQKGKSTKIIQNNVADDNADEPKIMCNSTEKKNQAVTKCIDKPDNNVVTTKRVLSTKRGGKNDETSTESETDSIPITQLKMLRKSATKHTKESQELKKNLPTPFDENTPSSLLLDGSPNLFSSRKAVIKLHPIDLIKNGKHLLMHNETSAVINGNENVVCNNLTAKDAETIIKGKPDIRKVKKGLKLGSLKQKKCQKKLPKRVGANVNDLVAQIISDFTTSTIESRNTSPNAFGDFVVKTNVELLNKSPKGSDLNSLKNSHNIDPKDNVKPSNDSTNQRPLVLKNKSIDNLIQMDRLSVMKSPIRAPFMSPRWEPPAINDDINATTKPVNPMPPDVLLKEPILQKLWPTGKNAENTASSSSTSSSSSSSSVPVEKNIFQSVRDKTKKFFGKISKKKSKKPDLLMTKKIILPWSSLSSAPTSMKKPLLRPSILSGSIPACTVSNTDEVVEGLKKLESNSLFIGKALDFRQNSFSKLFSIEKTDQKYVDVIGEVDLTTGTDDMLNDPVKESSQEKLDGIANNPIVRLFDCSKTADKSKATNEYVAKGSQDRGKKRRSLDKFKRRKMGSGRTARKSLIMKRKSLNAQPNLNEAMMVNSITIHSEVNDQRNDYNEAFVQELTKDLTVFHQKSNEITSKLPDVSNIIRTPSYDTSQDAASLCDIVNKIKDTNEQSESEEDLCLAAIAKSLNNKFMNSDEFNNDLDSPPTEPSEPFDVSPAAVDELRSPMDKSLSIELMEKGENIQTLESFTKPNFLADQDENTNTELVDMDLEDNVSVYTSFSMDTSITSSGGSKGGKKKRRIRRSINLKSHRKKRQSDTFLVPSDTYFCDICSKTFRTAGGLATHKTTLTHISKLSEQEFLRSKLETSKIPPDVTVNNTAADPESEPATATTADIIEEPEIPSPTAAQIDRLAVPKDPTSFSEQFNGSSPLASSPSKDPTSAVVSPARIQPTHSYLNQCGIEPISSPEQMDFTYDRYASLTSRPCVVPTDNSRLTLSQEERLFYECCSMLKGSDRSALSSNSTNKYYSVGRVLPTSDLSPTKPVTPRSNEQYNSYLMNDTTRHSKGIPKIDINQFSDISSDSNPAFSCPQVPASAESQNIFALESNKNLDHMDYGAQTVSFSKPSTCKKDVKSPLSKSIGDQGYLEQMTRIDRRYPQDEWADMGDSFPSSQDDNESDHYVQTILKRTNKSIEDESNQLATYSSTDLRESIVPSERNIGQMAIAQIPSADHNETIMESLRSPIDSPLHSTSSQSSTLSKPRTKAALKGYENLKVSIPTTGLDMQQALNRSPNPAGCKLAALADIALGNDVPHAVGLIRSACIEPEQPTVMPFKEEDGPTSDRIKLDKICAVKEQSGKKKMNVSKFKQKPKAVSNRKNKIKGNNSVKQNESPKLKDVYDFDDSRDSTDQPLVPLSQSRSKLNEAELPSKLNEDAQGSPESSYSDRDDFNYDSVSESESSGNESHASSAITNRSIKSINNVQKKCLIMGRIFKAAKKTETASDKQQQTTKKPIPKQELDKLFDSLRGGKKDKAEMNEKKSDMFDMDSCSGKTLNRGSSNADDRDKNEKPKRVAERRSRKPREIANLEAEWGMSMEQIIELIGVGQRKTQRRCAANKQRTFAETWSSDEYEDFHSTKDIIALVQEAEVKARRARIRSAKMAKKNDDTHKGDTVKNDDENDDDYENDGKKNGKVTKQSDSEDKDAASDNEAESTTLNESKKKVPKELDKDKENKQMSKAKHKEQERIKKKKLVNKPGGEDDRSVARSKTKKYTPAPAATATVTTTTTTTTIPTATANVDIDTDDETDLDSEWSRTVKRSKINKRRKTIAFRETDDVKSKAKLNSKTSTKPDSSPETTMELNRNRPKEKLSHSEQKPMARRKRIASEMLYYWSSSSDEEFGRIKPRENYDDDNLEQHGWIVGDSHKKLVTLLAHAKGKKIEDCGVKEAFHKKKS